MPGYAASYANDINTGGQVVGYETTGIGGDGYSAAFVYGNGVMLDLTTLPIFYGGNATIANGINSAGQVVGQSLGLGSPYGLGFFYANGKIQPSPLNFNFLGSDGGIGGASFAINDSGEIAGVGYNYYGGNDCAAVYSNGSLQPLITTASSVATAINSNGDAVGQSFYQSRQPFSFLYANGNVIPLSLTASQFADALNDEDQIVGTMNGDAALYDGGITTDLNSLIPPGSDWDLEAAMAINNSGQIVGYGINPSGQTDGFLLAPSVPEPRALAVLALVFLGLLTRPPRRGTVNSIVR